jgi:hypothetical protein
VDEWLQVATEPAVGRRSLKYAIAVGVLLITINHDYALFHEDLTIVRALEMGLTMLVPYCVSTMSSVGAIREARSGQTSAQPRQATEMMVTPEDSE